VKTHINPTPLAGVSEDVALLEDFLSWVTITGRGDRARNIVGQLNTLRQDAGLERFPAHERIDRALKRADHWGDLDRNERGPQGERLAFPLEAYKGWIDRHGGNATERRFLRDTALVAVMFRLMRRSIDASRFRKSHARVQNGNFEFNLSHQKGHHGDAWLILEASGGVYCPHRRFSDFWYSAEVQALAPDDLLFRTFSPRRDGSDHIDSKLVTKAVRDMIRIADIEHPNRYSSHSLRIGGATAALAAGMSMDQIRAIGGWKSDVIDRYLRQVEVARTGLSGLMGF
jgi:hypothetical protein